MKKPPPDPRDKFVAAVSTSALPNGAVFSSRPSSARRWANFKQFAERAAKRERGHALHASNGEQVRRIRHSNSLLAPKARPRTAAAAPFYVNSMNGRLGRQDEERWCGGCSCTSGAGAVNSSMGWPSQMSSAVAGEARPTVPGQDVPASTTWRIGCSSPAASIGRGTANNARQSRTVGCCMWYRRSLAVWWSVAA